MRPSALLGLDGEFWPAYCIDEAVFAWGSWVTQELQKVKGKTEAVVQRGQERKLQIILGTEKSTGFRDPAAAFK